MSMFVYFKICPHPDLPKEQKERWASSWWIFLFLALFVGYSTLFIGELVLN